MHFRLGAVVISLLAAGSCATSSAPQGRNVLVGPPGVTIEQYPELMAACSETVSQAGGMRASDLAIALFLGASASNNAQRSRVQLAEEQCLRDQGFSYVWLSAEEVATFNALPKDQKIPYIVEISNRTSVEGTQTLAPN